MVHLSSVCPLIVVTTIVSSDFDFMVSLGAMYIGVRFYTRSKGYETGASLLLCTNGLAKCFSLCMQRLLKAVFQFGQASISWEPALSKLYNKWVLLESQICTEWLILSIDQFSSTNIIPSRSQMKECSTSNSLKLTSISNCITAVLSQLGLLVKNQVDVCVIWPSATTISKETEDFLTS